jgi:hypothetical protein
MDQPVTFTCVPPGAGVWLDIDLNQNGVLDGAASPLNAAA